MEGRRIRASVFAGVLLLGASCSHRARVAGTVDGGSLDGGADAGNPSDAGAALDAGPCPIFQTLVGAPGPWQTVGVAVGPQVVVVTESTTAATSGNQAAYEVLDRRALEVLRSPTLLSSGGANDGMAAVTGTASGFAVGAASPPNGGALVQFLGADGDAGPAFAYPSGVSSTFPLSIASDQDNAALLWEDAGEQPVLVYQGPNGTPVAPVPVVANSSGDPLWAPTLGNSFFHGGCPWVFGDRTGVLTQTLQIRTLFPDGGSSPQAPYIDSSVRTVAAATVGTFGAVAWVNGQGELRFRPPGGAGTAIASVAFVGATQPGLVAVVDGGSVTYGLCYASQGWVRVRTLASDGSTVADQAVAPGGGVCSLAGDPLSGKYVVAFTKNNDAGTFDVEVAALCVP